MKIITVSLLLMALVVCVTNAHSITVAAGARDCFFEELKKDDQMTTTYQVSSGPTLAIDFSLTSPSGSMLHSSPDKDTGTFSLTASEVGKYTFCFSNVANTEKVVSFNVHGVIYVNDDGSTRPIEREIVKLAGSVRAVKDEQTYIVVRERIHRNTAESTNDRVKYWSATQFVVVVGVCAFQVYFLKRFFEVKSII